MTRAHARSAFEAAASRLRGLAFSAPSGTLIGAETQLIEKLGVSRLTLRQAARLLEAEGLLMVRRGPSGGYFSARPSTAKIESVFGGYLSTVNLDIEETFIVGFAIWTEIVRQAAALRTPEVRAVAKRLRERLLEMPADAPFTELVAFEDDYRRSIFQIVRRPYAELMFTLNRAVAWRHDAAPKLSRQFESLEPAFAREWRKSKRFEIDAIDEGDEGLALLAATRDRSLWRERLFGKGVQLSAAPPAVNAASAPAPATPSRPGRGRGAE